METKKKSWLGGITLLGVLILVAPTTPALAEEGDPAVLAMMHTINEGLAELGLDIAVEQIHFFTIGIGRPANRIHQNGLRWVPGDPRRAAQGDDITYLVDQSDGKTSSGFKTKLTPLYSVVKGRKVKVKATRFMEKAMDKTYKNVEKIWMDEAEFRFERALK